MRKSVIGAVALTGRGCGVDAWQDGWAEMRISNNVLFVREMLKISGKLR